MKHNESTLQSPWRTQTLPTQSAQRLPAPILHKPMGTPGFLAGQQEGLVQAQGLCTYLRQRDLTVKKFRAYTVTM